MPWATELIDFISDSGSAGGKESLHQLAFTADCHPGKTLEPTADGNLGFPIHPVREQAELIRGDVALLNAVE